MDLSRWRYEEKNWLTVKIKEIKERILKVRLSGIAKLTSSEKCRRINGSLLHIWNARCHGIQLLSLCVTFFLFCRKERLESLLYVVYLSRSMQSSWYFWNHDWIELPLNGSSDGFWLQKSLLKWAKYTLFGIVTIYNFCCENIVIS